VVTLSGRMQPDIDRRIAQALRAFRTLCKPLFSNRDLKWRPSKGILTCVLSVLLYRSESGHLSGKSEERQANLQNQPFSWLSELPPW